MGLIWAQFLSTLELVLPRSPMYTSRRRSRRKMLAAVVAVLSFAAPPSASRRSALAAGASLCTLGAAASPAHAELVTKRAVALDLAATTRNQGGGDHRPVVTQEAASFTASKVTVTAPAGDDDIEDRQAMQLECKCGGLMVKGDGRKWSDEEADIECKVCARQWLQLGLPGGRGAPIGDIGINSIEREKDHGNARWENLRGAQIDECSTDPRVRSPEHRLCNVELSRCPMRSRLSVARTYGMDNATSCDFVFRRNSVATPRDHVQLVSTSDDATGRRRRSVRCRSHMAYRQMSMRARGQAVRACMYR